MPSPITTTPGGDCAGCASISLGGTKTFAVRRATLSSRAPTRYANNRAFLEVAIATILIGLLGDRRRDVGHRQAWCEAKGMADSQMEHSDIVTELLLSLTSSGARRYSNAKIRFQSFFMLMTGQSLLFASSYRVCVKAPTLVSGNPCAGP